MTPRCEQPKHRLRRVLQQVRVIRDFAEGRSGARISARHSVVPLMAEYAAVLEGGDRVCGHAAHPFAGRQGWDGGGRAAQGLVGEELGHGIRRVRFLGKRRLSEEQPASPLACGGTWSPCVRGLSGKLLVGSDSGLWKAMPVEPADHRWHARMTARWAPERF